MGVVLVILLVYEAIRGVRRGEDGARWMAFASVAYLFIGVVTLAMMARPDPADWEMRGAASTSS